MGSKSTIAGATAALAMRSPSVCACQHTPAGILVTEDLASCSSGALLEQSARLRVGGQRGEERGPAIVPTIRLFTPVNDGRLPPCHFARLVIVLVSRVGQLAQRTHDVLRPFLDLVNLLVDRRRAESRHVHLVDELPDPLARDLGERCQLGLLRPVRGRESDRLRLQPDHMLKQALHVLPHGRDRPDVDEEILVLGEA